MTETIHFRASRLKVRRARTHLAEFKNVVSQYIETKPCWLVQEDAGNGKVVWTIRVERNPPEEIPVILGDVVHNLRATLDLLACRLVELNGGNADNVYFPFAFEEGEFEYMLKKRGMLAASDADLKVLRSMKPYHGGNAALRAIHDLDIVDKHRTLIAVMHAAKLPQVNLAGNHITMSVSMVDGSKAITCEKSPNYPIGHKELTLPQFHFEWDAPLSGEIIPTLHHLCHLVDGIIDAFAALR